MLPDLYWIDNLKTGKLAIMPRPRAGEWLRDEIAGLHQLTVNILVCLLETSEIIELGLTEEHTLCEQQHIEFLHFPIKDRDVPTSMTATIEVCQYLVKQLQANKNVAIHCRAGIGRSALIAACLLVGAGEKPQEVFKHISMARGLIVPDTIKQTEWLVKFSQSITLR